LPGVRIVYVAPRLTVKYGDALEAYGRFAEAFDLDVR
jgi:hypothetical protein